MNMYNYYFKYINGEIYEGSLITLEILDTLNEPKNVGKQIKRIIHNDSNGLYILYKNVRYYDMYHIKY